MTGDQTRSTVGPASAGLTAAAEHLAVWHGPDSAARVRAGHDAITAIDNAMRALYATREHLVTEIHNDNIERAARVDELLARVRAERFGHPDGYDYRRETDDQAADDGPEQPGVAGWRVDGAR